MLKMKVAFAFFIILTFVFVSKCDDFECTAGVPYLENNCNDCVCQNGVLQCSFKACISHNDGTYNKCKHGTTWKENCNECWCTDLYGTLCTNYDC